MNYSGNDIKSQTQDNSKLNLPLITQRDIFPSVVQIQKVISNFMKQANIVIEYDPKDKYHVFSTIISQHSYFRKFMEYLAFIAPKLLRKASLQLVNVIYYLLNTRMNTINWYIESQGISKRSYSHFDCVYYMFESMDALYNRLQGINGSQDAIAEIDSIYQNLLERYETIEQLLKSNKMYQENPRLLLAA